MRVEYKVTCWKQIDIDDAHKAELLIFLNENFQASATDIFNWCLDRGIKAYASDRDGTECDMTPAENGGRATIEVYDMAKGDEVLFMNGKP